MLFSNRVRAAIADAADGADGIFQRRAHPDYSTTGSAFTPEGNVDPERPKKRLRPTSRQSSVSERRCSSPIGRKLRKIARSAKSGRPMSSIPFGGRGVTL